MLLLPCRPISNIKIGSSTVIVWFFKCMEIIFCTHINHNDTVTNLLYPYQFFPRAICLLVYILVATSSYLINALEINSFVPEPGMM